MILFLSTEMTSFRNYQNYSFLPARRLSPPPHVSGYFWIRNFYSGLKKFPVHTLRVQIEFACPHASDGIRIYSKETRDTGRAAILVYCSPRLETFLLPHRIQKYPDSPSARYPIRYGQFCFLFGFAAGCAWTETVCMQKEKAADSKISGYDCIRLSKPNGQNVSSRYVETFKKPLTAEIN